MSGWLGCCDCLCPPVRQLQYARAGRPRPMAAARTAQGGVDNLAYQEDEPPPPTQPAGRRRQSQLDSEGGREVCDLRGDSPAGPAQRAPADLWQAFDPIARLWGPEKHRAAQERRHEPAAGGRPSSPSRPDRPRSETPPEDPASLELGRASQLNNIPEVPEDDIAVNCDTDGNGWPLSDGGRESPAGCAERGSRDVLPGAPGDDAPGPGEGGRRGVSDTGTEHSSRWAKRPRLSLFHRRSHHTHRGKSEPEPVTAEPDSHASGEQRTPSPDTNPPVTPPDRRSGPASGSHRRQRMSLFGRRAHSGHGSAREAAHSRHAARERHWFRRLSWRGHHGSEPFSSVTDAADHRETLAPPKDSAAAEPTKAAQRWRVVRDNFDLDAPLSQHWNFLETVVESFPKVDVKSYTEHVQHHTPSSSSSSEEDVPDPQEAQLILKLSQSSDIRPDNAPLLLKSRESRRRQSGSDDPESRPEGRDQLTPQWETQLAADSVGQRASAASAASGPTEDVVRGPPSNRRSSVLERLLSPAIGQVRRSSLPSQVRADSAVVDTRVRGATWFQRPAGDQLPAAPERQPEAGLTQRRRATVTELSLSRFLQDVDQRARRLREGEFSGADPYQVVAPSQLAGDEHVIPIVDSQRCVRLMLADAERRLQEEYRRTPSPSLHLSACSSPESRDLGTPSSAASSAATPQQTGPGPANVQAPISDRTSSESKPSSGLPPNRQVSDKPSEFSDFSPTASNPEMPELSSAYDIPPAPSPNPKVEVIQTNFCASSRPQSASVVAQTSVGPPPPAETSQWAAGTVSQWAQTSPSTCSPAAGERSETRSAQTSPGTCSPAAGEKPETRSAQTSPGTCSPAAGERPETRSAQTSPGTCSPAAGERPETRSAQTSPGTCSRPTMGPRSGRQPQAGGLGTCRMVERPGGSGWTVTLWPGPGRTPPRRLADWSPCGTQRHMDAASAAAMLLRQQKKQEAAERRHADLLQARAGRAAQTAAGSSRRTWRRTVDQTRIPGSRTSGRPPGVAGPSGTQSAADGQKRQQGPG